VQERYNQEISPNHEITNFSNIFLWTIIDILVVWNYCSCYCTLNRCNSTAQKLFSISTYLISYSHIYIVFLEKVRTKNIKHWIASPYNHFSRISSSYMKQLGLFWSLKRKDFFFFFWQDFENNIRNLVMFGWYTCE